MAWPDLCLLNASTNMSPGTKLQASSLAQYCCWSLGEVTWRNTPCLARKCAVAWRIHVSCLQYLAYLQSHGHHPDTSNHMLQSCSQHGTQHGTKSEADRSVHLLGPALSLCVAASCWDTPPAGNPQFLCGRGSGSPSPERSLQHHPWDHGRWCGLRSKALLSRAVTALCHDCTPGA